MTPSKTITLGIAPFENLSGRDTLQVWGKSFVYELVTQLSRFKQFQIRVLKSEDHVPEDVDYLIAGSYRLDSSDNLHIHARLINTESELLLWANHFEGKQEELLNLQHNLIHEITASLQQQVKYALLSRIRNKPPVKLKAYECWLHGMEELKKGTVKSDMAAREYFQRAIDIEPDYSLAYSGMSMTYFNEWSCQLWDRWEVSQNGAFEWAEKAIILDEENYVAALVLGRVFLYEGAYESSEFYLNKSLGLNSNDPDTLVQISSCMVYLGKPELAWELYLKAVALNPSRKAAWNTVAAFILFELNKMKEATQYIIRADQSKWVDAPAFYAAMHFYLGDHDKMREYWNQYLSDFGKLIMHGKPFTETYAIDWMREVNPFRYDSRLQDFWKFIGDYEAPAVEDSHSGANQNIFRKEDELWELNYDQKSVHLTEVKGFHDLNKLLAKPGHSFHCAELMGAVLDERGTKVIDARAKKEYQRKILDLQEEIQFHESSNDFIRAEEIQAQYDQLVDHLSQSLGLQGQIRTTGRTIDKARSAVTWRIRSAISRIEKVHPSMGKHLNNAVKTGTLCSYLPEKNTEWEL